MFIDSETICIDYKTAQDNISIAFQSIKKFVDNGSAVIVAIATPSVQTIASAARKTPIVFVVGTDLWEAKLVLKVVVMIWLLINI